jgi:amino acid transporter
MSQTSEEQDTSKAVPDAGGLEVVKRLVVGRPRASHEVGDTLLSKVLALPIFAADALSSVAYATEAALIVLLGASAAGGDYILGVSIAIAIVLGIVVLSYTQTVQAYQTSGGAYVVAKENLGTLPSLVAAAALLVDYVLTVAVSVTAGVFALVSAAPSLEPHMVALSLAFVVVLTVVNLRGVRESGFTFALPTYGFILAMFVLVGTGVAKCALGGSCPRADVPHPLLVGTGTVTIFVLLRAFSSGAAALTGVEAVSNGVNAFRHPQGKNAAKTLVAMGTIAIFLFVGVSWLAMEMHAKPSSSVSVLSEIARGVFPPGSSGAILFYVVQGLTFVILVLAANTSYQGFPRLAAVLAKDRFFPRQFVNLGDRLVYSNGIIVLASLASFLIWIFDANVNSLIHLYVLGVFTAFTLSQWGMVRYWLRGSHRSARRHALINGAGACCTALVMVLVIETKFLEGAWAVVVAIPVLVLSFYGINRHYRKVARRLRAGSGAVAAAPPATNEVVVYVESADPALNEAVWYARQIAGTEFHAIHVPGAHSDTGIRPRFRQLTDIRPDLEVIQPEDGRADTVIDYVWALPRGESNFVTVIVPEHFRRPSLFAALRRRTELSLKVRLLREPGVVITNVTTVGDPRAIQVPKRVVCRVLTSGGHAASLRAMRYAETLGFEDTKALFFSFDDEETARIREEWALRSCAMDIEIEQAPYRDLADPLLRYVRWITADEDALCVLILPELVFSGSSRLLHNQRALYLKRLLLFEPRVVLASVPYRLG